MWRALFLLACAGPEPDLDPAERDALREMKLPLFVKPVHEGSSKGITEKNFCRTTSELEEALHVPDRLLVMSKGRIVRELRRGTATREEVMAASEATTEANGREAAR